jgi:hypothetical protein
LNKVVKIDVARSTSVKGSNHQLGKLRWPENNFCNPLHK